MMKLKLEDVQLEELIYKHFLGGRDGLRSVDVLVLSFVWFLFCSIFGGFV